jgi:hypothetical protein
LVVRVRDACNNESYCDYPFEVASIKKPAAVCVTMLSTRLTPMDRDGDGQVDTAMATVWASEFNSSSEVACGDTSLEYRLELFDGIDDNTWEEDADSLVVGCTNFGAKLARLWVISQPSGTVDFCNVVLIVQTDFVGCVFNQSEDITPLTQLEDPDRESTQSSKGNGDDPLEMGSIPADQISNQAPEFALYQNRPNPFRAETLIGFMLPEAMEAILTVYDVTGKVLKVVEGDFIKGYNEISLKIRDLGMVGTLFYQLDTRDYTATRKMIIVQ